MRDALSDAARWVRTGRHLRLAQVVARARLRAQKAAFAHWGPALAPRLARPIGAGWGWPADFVPLDATVDDLPAPPGPGGVVTFLNGPRRLGDPVDWAAPGASQLWRYHLHYWEWAWPLAASEVRDGARERFAVLWRSWQSGTTPGRWDAWSPYVVSVRAWALCGLHRRLVAGASWERSFAEEVARHAGYVAANVERDVGGNHLIKNIKAMVGTGVWLGDDRLVARGAHLLEAQLPIQVLADGGHYERSPSYHCQVLGDLVDIAGLLHAGGRPEVGGLDEAIERMRRWLGSMTMPDGTLPLLNDCASVAPPRLAALSPVAPAGRGLKLLQPSGYAVIRKGPWRLVADVGPPCPPDLPAHAHADTLSFVLHHDGRPAVVDTGAFEYGDTPRRRYERSTAAHNTVEVDGQDSTEVWGAFRAGRRAAACVERAAEGGAEVRLTASHDGYRHLPGAPRVRRTWVVTDRDVEVTDEVEGSGTHDVVARLHAPAGETGVAPVEVTWAPRDVACQEGPCDVSESFGAQRHAVSIEGRRRGPLPIRIEARVVVPEPPTVRGP